MYLGRASRYEIHNDERVQQLKENMDALPIIFTAGATGVTAIFGGWDTVFQVFIILMILDMITGVFKGFKEKNFSSKRMREGFVTKFGYIIVIVIATQFDRLMPANAPLLRTLALWFYIFVEGLSIIENLAHMGVPIPQGIVDRLSSLQGKGGGQAKLGADGKFATVTTETVATTETTVTEKVVVNPDELPDEVDKVKKK